MPEYNLGTASGQIKITSDTKGVTDADAALGRYVDTAGRVREANGKFAAGAKPVEDANRRVTMSTQQATVALGVVGKTVGGAGLAIVGGLSAAVKTAADFEQGLSGIQAVSGATTGEMEKVRAKALQIGKDTAFSASEASSAIEELVKAGVSIPDVMNGAADATVALAAASGVSLPEAASIASNAMNAFGLSAKELPKVADQIAGAANASAIDVSDFGQSMAASSAVAHLAGVSFNDTAVAIAELGNVGIKGSDAGTSLKTMFQNLTPQTKKAATEFKALGLITADGSNKFYDAQGNLKGLSDVSQILQDSLKGMTAEQKQSTLATLFGSDAIRAAATLANNGAKGFDTLATSMGKVSAADVAKTRLDNLNGSFEQLKGSVETVAIQVGSVLLPVLKTIVDAITNVVNRVGELSPAFVAAATVAATIGGVLATVAGGAALLVAHILPLVEAMGGLPAILGVLRTALAAVTGPVGLVIAALVLMYSTSSTFRDAINGLVGTVVSLVGSLVGQLAPAFTAIVNAIVPLVTTLLNTLVPVLSQLITALIPVLVSVFGLVAKVITTVVAAVTPLIVQLVGALVPVIAQLVNTVLPPLVAIFTEVATAVVPLVSALASALIPVITQIVGAVIPPLIAILGVIITVVQSLLPVITTVFGAIASIITAALQVVTGIINVFIGLLTGNWSMVWSGLGTVVQGAWNLVVSIIQGAINIIISVFQALAGLLAPILTPIWNGIVTGVQGMVAGVQAFLAPIVGFFQTVFGAIGAFLGQVMNVIKIAVLIPIGLIVIGVQTYLNILKAFWSTIFNALLTILTPIVNAIKTTITNFLNGVKVIWTAGVTVLKTVFTTIFNAIKTFISPAVNAIKAVITTAINAIKSVWTSVWNAIKAVVTAVWNAIKPFVSAAVNSIRSTITSAVNTIKAVWSAAWNAVKTTITTVWNGIKSGVTTGINAVITLVSGIKGKILGALSGAASWLVSVGRNIIDGMVNGIKGMVSNVIGAITGVAKSAISAAKNLLGIHSPSTVFAAIGKYLVLGFRDGIVGNADQINTAITKLVADIGAKFDTMVEDRKAAQAKLKKLNQELVDLDAPKKGTGKGAGTAYAKALDTYKERRAAIKKEIADEKADIATLTKMSKKGTEAGITKLLKEDNAKLVKLSNARAVIADKLKTAQDKLGDAIKTRDDYAASVASAVIGMGNVAKAYSDALNQASTAAQNADSLAQKIADLDSSVDSATDDRQTILDKIANELTLSKNGTTVAQRTAALNQVATLTNQLGDIDKKVATYASTRAGLVQQMQAAQKTAGMSPVDQLIANLQDQVASTKRFQDILAELKKQGIDDTTYKQLVDNFAQTGDFSAAFDIEQGGATAVKQIADLQKQLGAAANDLGTTTADSLYLAGINAAKGIVAGLQSQQDALDKQMDKIADSLVKSIKKKLDIHSPSGVTDREVGRHIVGGIIAGAEHMHGALTNAMHRVGDIATGALSGLSGPIAMAALGGAGASSGPLGAGMSTAAGRAVSNTNSRTLVYNNYGSQGISAEDDLFTAMRRSRTVVPGWGG